jgi:hypothetical protein
MVSTIVSTAKDVFQETTWSVDEGRLPHDTDTASLTDGRVYSTRERDQILSVYLLHWIHRSLGGSERVR